jgi:hypothetical protein
VEKGAPNLYSNFLRGAGNIFFKNALLFPYVHVNMPRRFSNLSLLPRWLPDAPLVFVNASECTMSLDLQPPYACDARIIWQESGFLKSVLQNDFVCFKYLLGTSVILLLYICFILSHILYLNIFSNI